MKQFDQVEVKKPAVNVFELSHDVKASYNFDKLYPFFARPVYPGDTFNCSTEMFLRTMPLKAPVMHNVDMHTYWFFVPDRLLWNENKRDDFKIFITGGEDGKKSPVLPTWTYGRLEQYFAQQDNAEELRALYRHGSLMDHMGFPTLPDDGVAHTSASKEISSLPFRAYQLVWNEYFRNQNVQNEVEFSYDSGPEDSDTMVELLSYRYKNWEKDYFTSCLPWAQRGEAVTLPISAENVRFSGNLQGTAKVNSAKAAGQTVAHGLVAEGINTYTGVAVQGLNVNDGTALSLEGTSTITSGNVTFTGLAIGTINDFRYCLRLQQWLENNARCGSRYIEQLFSHFGVISSDARLQRPELLGGGKVPLIFTDIPQTSSTDQESVQGNLSGKGTLYGKTGGFRKYFEEHGILLGICCIIPRTSYSQGIPREWCLYDKTDWYFPEFAHLGEQAVLNSELYYDPSASPVIGDDGPDGVFGYQGRFTELRYYPSSVHGELRDTLQYWHFGRLFDQTPALNSMFVEADTRANVFAIEDVANGTDDPFVCQIHVKIRATRPLPKFATPTL